MVEGEIFNKRLWEHNSQLRENGVFTIGSYTTVLNPLPILNRSRNETSILNSIHLCVIM